MFVITVWSLAELQTLCGVLVIPNHTHTVKPCSKDIILTFIVFRWCLKVTFFFCFSSSFLDDPSLSHQGKHFKHRQSTRWPIILGFLGFTQAYIFVLSSGKGDKHTVVLHMKKHKEGNWNTRPYTWEKHKFVKNVTDTCVNPTLLAHRHMILMHGMSRQGLMILILLLFSCLLPWII